MLGSFIILSFFSLGLAMAHFRIVPDTLLEHDYALVALWLLMAFVGLSLGADKKLPEILRSLNPRVLLLPLATTCGTFAGATLAALFLTLTVADCLAVSSGFAYYSLSSIFITQYKGADLGAVALICNISRELFTLVFTPLVVRLFGAPAAISCGGASTVDTTLPVISRYAGAPWVFPAIIHAVILDFSVPFWVAFFCSFS